MKRYRVQYRMTENASGMAQTEEVYADGWRVDLDKVVLFQHHQESDTPVFDIPKTRVMRIQEISS